VVGRIADRQGAAAFANGPPGSATVDYHRVVAAETAAPAPPEPGSVAEVLDNPSSPDRLDGRCISQAGSSVLAWPCPAASARSGVTTLPYLIMPGYLAWPRR